MSPRQRPPRSRRPQPVVTGTAPELHGIEPLPPWWSRVPPALLVALAATLLIGLIALAAHRPFQLLWHDEFQVHLQSSMLARFRLWMPAHPLADFFDTFYVLSKPVYAPQSFPGAALMFVPTVWLHLQPWVMPVIASGAACGLLWLVLSQLVDRPSATMAVFVLICTPAFERLSTMYMGHGPVLLLGLCAVASLLEYQKTQRLVWVAIAGASLGWAAITRPLDAACYGAIVAVGLVGTWRGMPRRSVAKAALLVVVSAMPFLAVQGVFNRGVTGSFTKTPFALYNERDQPALAYADSRTTRDAPATHVPQKVQFYLGWIMPFIRRHNEVRTDPVRMWADRKPFMLPMLGPLAVMVPITVIGLFALNTRRRWLVFSLFPLMVIGYSYYPMFLYQYVTFALPAVALLYALAPNVIAQAFDTHTLAARRVAFGLMGVLSIVGVARGAVGAPVDPMNFEANQIRARLEAEVVAPAIVLFSQPQIPEQVHFEPVYNDYSPWPDDAPVIRAHDFGMRNVELYRYYAERQPQRTVWSYDRATATLTLLGRVGDLALRPSPADSAGRSSPTASPPSPP